MTCRGSGAAGTGPGDGSRFCSPDNDNSSDVNHMRSRRARQHGVALVEVALFSLIAAALVTAVIRGQELVESARVRAVILQQESARSAYFAFQDRFRALPGDYAYATANIRGVTVNGNGNALIEPNGAPLGASGTPYEVILAWDHMSKAGFLGNYEFDLNDRSRSNPFNIYGGYLDIGYDNTYGDPGVPGRPLRHTLKTGHNIPASVLAEADRKIDDGNGLTGTFQFSNHAWCASCQQPAGPGQPGQCIDAAGIWAATTGTTSRNCGAASFL
jgi:hypothetical protein